MTTESQPLERRGLDDPYPAIDDQEVYYSTVHNSWAVRSESGGESYSENIGEGEARELVEEFAKMRRLEEANTVRPWPFNSERLTITLGICGDAQEGEFMNATLQSADGNLEFSVAVHVDVPDKVKTQEQLACYLGGIFGDLLDRPTGQGLHVEVQLGPMGDGEDE